jgi:hypothetical protein
MNRTSFSLGLLLSLALTACGTTFPLTPDAAVPFASGEVDASFEDNGNNQFTLAVKGLGPASKLNPAATTYVVWVTPKKQGASAQNVGALSVDDGHEGKLEFSTTVNEFSLSITPEPAADALKPSGRDVLSGQVSNR